MLPRIDSSFFSLWFSGSLRYLRAGWVGLVQRAYPLQRSVAATRRWRVVVGCGALLSLAGYTQVKERPAQPVAPISVADTAAGTDAIRDMGIAAFAEGLGEVILDGGILTDELREPLNGLNGLHTLDNPASGMAGGKGGWPYSSNYPWRRLSWMDIRMLPERWNPSDTATELDLGATRQEALLDNAYLQLQGARAVLSTAQGQLAHAAPAGTDPAVLNVYRGELYALEGYADVMLADLFCSGVPLNTFAEPFKKMLTLRQGERFQDSIPGHTYTVEEFAMGADGVEFSRSNLGGEHQVRLVPASSIRRLYLSAIANKMVVYRPSSATAQVYQTAIAKFDTALTLAGDSARILNLARVGKGRAWLSLGQYDSAAAAVAQVPRGFAYRLRSFLNLDPDGDEILATVADREGRNGLPYLSSGDPRTATEIICSDKGMGGFRFPAKFWPDSDRAKYQKLWTESIQGSLSGNGNSKYEPSQLAWPFTLANWEEAVLIQAEAALHTQHSQTSTTSTTRWLQLLNELRATALIPGTTRPNPAKLVPLKDPGSERGRVALVFSERAYWLFLTGHRQGDLRRLVRQYNWTQDQAYPTGPYIVPQNLLPQVGQYGMDVNLPIPPEELSNPHFEGCLDRGA